jgi:hypothetical protein
LTVPLDTLTWLLRCGERHARRVLLKDAADQMMPFYHLVTPEKQDVVLACEWDSLDEKLAAMAIAKHTAHDLHATAALFVTEAWVVKRKLDGVPNTEWHRRRFKEMLQDNTPPMEHPDRIEVVAMFATDGKDTRSIILQTIRDKPGGKIIALVKDLSYQDDDYKLTGRMIDGLIEHPGT